MLISTEEDNLCVDFSRGILNIVILFFDYTNYSKVINPYNACNLQQLNNLINQQ